VARGPRPHATRARRGCGCRRATAPPSTPHRLRRAHRLPPLRRRDEQRGAVGDGCAEQVFERGADAVVGDPARGRQGASCAQSIACGACAARGSRRVLACEGDLDAAPTPRPLARSACPRP
jgi:hypothetical protein